MFQAPSDLLLDIQDKKINGSEKISSEKWDQVL